MRATDLAHALSQRAEDVCRHLLPLGVRKGRDWCCGDLSGSTGDSLKICLEGSKAGVWADFADTGSTGDLIGLWQKARNIELQEACREAEQFLGVPSDAAPQARKPIPTKAPSESWLRLQERLRKGTVAELESLAELRKLPGTAGLTLASREGNLFFADVWDDGHDYPSWIITDDSRRNAQARRMDGKPWSGINAKAKTIAGCEASWPIGAASLNGKDAVLVEGGPDFLAAWHAIWMKDKTASVRPVAMLGASQPIHPEALPSFAGKKVFLFPHSDAAGTKAVDKWKSQLAQSETKSVALGGHKDLNEFISAHGHADDSGELDPITDSLFPRSAPIEEDFDSPAPTPAPTGLQPKIPGKPLFSFTVPAADDPSIILGNRYLNKGDGAVLSSTSGMGKSAMAIQMAARWSLEMDAFGIKPSRPLRVLIFQSEDSEGDVAEVTASIAHVMQLTAAQVALCSERVRVVTDRVNRGTKFLSELKLHIAAHKPDLVIINPLQAFLDGDITASKDLGAFLREGLNGLNEPAQFAYLLVHHTTKPATGKDKAERQWHEVMYDMAGGAELINWARAILSLRATAQEGEFNLVLAKRGRRAGVTKEVEQGVGTRHETITTIPLKHAQGKLPNGQPVIYWETRATADVTPEEASERKGRTPKYDFGDYRSIFPPKSGKGDDLNQLHRALMPNGEIPKKQLHQVCKRWAADGHVEIIDIHGAPRRYRATL